MPYFRKGAEKKPLRMIGKGPVLLPERMKHRLMRSSDLYQSLIPRFHPGPEKLGQCRIISHRGEHDNVRVFENTLQAFEQAAAGGVWGLEFDVTWTRDLHPVVHHDPDLQRVFGCPDLMNQMDLAELKARFPLVPTLEEAVRAFGKHRHLMIEIKAAALIDPPRQNAILQSCLQDLQAQTDYHFLSLSPELFDLMPWVAPRTWIAVGELNLGMMSRIALERDLQGIAGHYALASRACLHRHHRRQQKVGTAYPGSRNCLFREINRGVDWIFSNRAVRLQSLIHSLLEEAEGMDAGDRGR